MIFFEALELEKQLLGRRSPPVISFTGGGGKTTAMFRLASELKDLGMRVLVTTTTAIFKPDHKRYDVLKVLTGSTVTDAAPPDRAGGSITVIASGYRMQKDKLEGITAGEVDLLADENIFDVILVEADGSRRRPVKAPAEHEPVVPGSTRLYIGVTGFDCFGKQADEETVHRLDEFLLVTGAAAGELIDHKLLLSLVNSQRGMFKDAPMNVQKIWLINKVDTEDQIEPAADLARYVLKESSVPDKVLVASFHQDDPVKIVF